MTCRYLDTSWATEGFETIRGRVNRISIKLELKSDAIECEHALKSNS
jgi:hypothetical protein